VCHIIDYSKVLWNGLSKVAAIARDTSTSDVAVPGGSTERDAKCS
jgi:hypothetical protein